MGTFLYVTFGTFSVVTSILMALSLRTLYNQFRAGVEFEYYGWTIIANLLALTLFILSVSVFP